MPGGYENVILKLNLTRLEPITYIIVTRGRRCKLCRNSPRIKLPWTGCKIREKIADLMIGGRF